MADIEKETKAPEEEPVDTSAQTDGETEGAVDEQTSDAGKDEAEENGEQDETAEAEAAEEDSQEDKKDGGKFFKKKDKKKDKTKEKIEELEDRVKRQLAEFENFRNRTEKEKAAMFDMGAKSVIEKLLPVVDNFERGLASVSKEEQDGAFCDGMNKIYRQLMTELDNIGVKPIEAVGTEFNPDLHNAVMQVESEEYESGFVAQELQKGYLYRDSVVRHSMVAVVQ